MKNSRKDEWSSGVLNFILFIKILFIGSFIGGLIGYLIHFLDIFVLQIIIAMISSLILGYIIIKHVSKKLQMVKYGIKSKKILKSLNLYFIVQYLYLPSFIIHFYSMWPPFLERFIKYDLYILILLPTIEILIIYYFTKKILKKHFTYNN